MRTLRILAAAALVLSVAACASSSSPGWTFSPTEPPTPAPAQPSGAPPSGAQPSAAPPTVAPGSTNATTGAGGGTASSGVSVNLVAQNVAFDQTAITVPANTTFTINFDNRDAGIPHNVAIHKDSPTGEAVFTGEIVTGPVQKVYTVGGLDAGAYAFVCTVHPNMTGTLTVTP